MSQGDEEKKSLEERVRLWHTDRGESPGPVAHFFLQTWDADGMTSSVPAPKRVDELCYCVELLKAFPEWRDKLPALARLNPDWWPIVTQWDRFRRLAGGFAKYEFDFGFDLMQRLMDRAIERVGSNLI